MRGSCQCGGVQFEVNGPVREMENCHCSKCRKAYGSAFGTIAVVSTVDFSYTTGRELIASYKVSERITRYHCRNCGSPLPLYEEWEELVGIPAGLLDDNPKCKPSLHIFVDSKACWWEITDGLPQYDEWPAEVNMDERAKQLKNKV